MTSQLHGIVLTLLLVITALVALLAGVCAAWLRTLEGATPAAAVLRGGAAFGTTLAVSAALLAVVAR
nr:hypothetical protein KitaXyl93_23680 [Kitasatospora sp. Xyl93]